MERGPIYVGGLDRCGKTMMRAFLASHRRIAIPAVGSNMWTYFYGQYGDLSQGDSFERCLDAMLHYKHVAFLEPDPSRIRREFWQDRPTYARLFALFLTHYAEREGKPRWGAQTGLIERYADHLFAAYAGLRIVHMIRDPRDRYEAALARSPEGKRRVGLATARWLYSAGLAKRNQRRYPNRYKIVRYETMVAQPEKTLREVCAFLDEEFSPAMLTMEGAPGYRRKLESGSPGRPGQSPISTSYIGRFRQEIPKQEIAFMQAFAGRDMRAYGYALEPNQFSLGDWLHFSIAEWPWDLLRKVTWRTMEAIQHNLPAQFGRKPGQSMVIDRTGARQSTQQTT